MTNACSCKLGEACDPGVSWLALRVFTRRVAVGWVSDGWWGFLGEPVSKGLCAWDKVSVSL